MTTSRGFIFNSRKRLEGCLRRAPHPHLACSLTLAWAPVEDAPIPCSQISSAPNPHFCPKLKLGATEFPGWDGAQSESLAQSCWEPPSPGTSSLCTEVGARRAPTIQCDLSSFQHRLSNQVLQPQRHVGPQVPSACEELHAQAGVMQSTLRKSMGSARVPA